MGRMKENPRYEVVSFRTTEEQKIKLNEARGSSSMSAFVDLLLTIYLQGHKNESTGQASASA
jgi:hypothetical protein